MSNRGPGVAIVCPTKKKRLISIKQKKKNFNLWHIEFGRHPNKTVQEKKIDIYASSQERA